MREKKERSLRELINASVRDNDRNFIVTHGGIGPILQILSSNSAELQYLAAHAIANLALDASGRQKIYQSGGVRILLDALSGEAKTKERVLAALSNLTLDDDSIRNDIASQRGLSRIVSAVAGGSTDTALQTTGMLCIANVAVNPNCANGFVVSGAVDVCIRNLNGRDTKQKKHALWACSALSTDGNSHAQLENNVRHFSFAFQGNDAIDMIKVLTILVNISGNISSHFAVINAGLINPTLKNLNGSEVNAKVLTLQFIQNFGLSDQGRSAVKNSGYVASIPSAINSLPPNLVVHGLRAITNITQDDEVRDMLVNAGAVNSVRKYLSASDSETREAAEEANNNLAV